MQYVDSITFPVTEFAEEINLTMYINSNVMGVQFCNSNDDADSTTYPATLTLDWSALTGGESELTSEEEQEASGGSSDEVVEEMDGLNIHYANEESDVSDADEADESEETDTEASSWKLLISRPAFFACFIIGCCFAAAGAGLLVTAIVRKKRDEKRVAREEGKEHAEND